MSASEQRYHRPARLRFAARLLAGCLLLSTAQAEERLELSAGYSYTNNTVLSGNLLSAGNHPLVDLDGRWRHWYANLQQGLGYNLIQQGPWQFGLGVNYLAGRQQQADPRLHGMGNVADGGLLAAVLKWEPIKDGAALTTSYFLQPGSSKLAYINIDAFAGIPGSATINGFVDINGNWGNNDYNQRLYGIDTQQAAHSGYKPFNCTGGWATVIAVVGVAVDVSPHWQWVAAAGSSSFAGSVANSPLVGHRQQATVYAFTTYRF